MENARQFRENIPSSVVDFFLLFLFICVKGLLRSSLIKRNRVNSYISEIQITEVTQTGVNHSTRKQKQKRTIEVAPVISSFCFTEPFKPQYLIINSPFMFPYFS